MKQLSMFDLMFRSFNPLAEVVKHSSPYWKESYNRIKDARNESPEHQANIVRREFCPYGAAGSYWGADERNSVSGYDMRTENIKVYYKDATGANITKLYTWREFAEELMEQMEE